MASCLSACQGGEVPEPGVNARARAVKTPPASALPFPHAAPDRQWLPSSNTPAPAPRSCHAFWSSARGREEGGDRIAARRGEARCAGAPRGRRRQPTNQRRARGCGPWQPALLLWVTTSSACARDSSDIYLLMTCGGDASADPTRQASRALFNAAGSFGAGRVADGHKCRRTGTALLLVGPSRRFVCLPHKAA
jgi:hypothetical protein